jgi:hypothetical protein
MALHHLIYQSTATRPMADADLHALLAQARAFNAAHHITGVLLYHEGQFVQVMEGEQATVRPLYDKICGDPRHRAVVKLADRELAGRSFGEWSMAFRPVQAADFATLAGFADPDRLAAAEGPEAADALLAQIVHVTFQDTLGAGQPAPIGEAGESESQFPG